MWGVVFGIFVIGIVVVVFDEVFENSGEEVKVFFYNVFEVEYY